MPYLIRLRSLALLAVVAGLLASTFVVAPAADAASKRQERLGHARHVALEQLGDRYRYGGTGPDRFDCSGLVYFSYRKAGFDRVPRTSAEQAAHARQIRKKNLRPGDFMYFHDGGGVYHVGIFLRWRDGHAVMLHSPGRGERVRKDRPWTHRWSAGTLRKR